MAQIESLRPAAREWVEDVWRSVEVRDCQRQLGFVYFVRNSDIYKIGIAQNMRRRMRELNPDEFLDCVRCSNFKEVERQLHARFKNVRIPQSEYFRLNRAQIQQVHTLMRELAAYEVY